MTDVAHSSHLNPLSHPNDASHLVSLSVSDAIDEVDRAFYDLNADANSCVQINVVLSTTLKVIDTHLELGLSLPYFENITAAEWTKKPKSLEVYITDVTEGRTLNRQSRGKDYATNILSYPSDLPAFMLTQLPHIELGELIICHAVALREAHEQGKSAKHHLTHLLVHGILHLLGFDHELGQSEQDHMEALEIEILQQLGVKNPYEL